MSDTEPSCLACRVVTGDARPAGGIVWRGRGFTVHAPLDPCPIAGWLIVSSDRHAPALADLGDQELAELGPVAAMVMRAQRSALGAEHVYAFAIGDVLKHFHLHLVPRYADTPERLRGRRCFEGKPEDMLPAAELERAAAAIASALR